MTWAIDLRARTMEVLLAANTLAGTKVYPERVEPHYISATKAAEKLPLLCMYVGDEVSKPNAARTVEDVTVDFVVCVLATGDDDLEAANTRDALLEQAKLALLKSDAWCDVLGKIEKVTTQRAHVRDDREILFSIGRLVFAVTLRADLESPEDLGPLEGVDMQLDVAPQDQTIELAVKADVET